MNRNFKSVLSILASPVVLLTFTGGALLMPQGSFVQQSMAQESADEDGAEVLTRGPVHEAFAETIVFKPVQGLLVPKAPPEAIDEIPPDQRPDGANVTWIPGYWAWDEEANEYLWVSGIWRNLPPGRQWVPGEWEDVDGKYQWYSGYWASAEEEEVEYLPAPPESIEAGPNIPSPSADSIWISGTWLYTESRYRWRPGYWDAGHDDWDWVPAHYVPARHGYVFVDGYWDHCTERRGLMFAPVRFRDDYHIRPGYRYRPTTVISTVGFLNHLFLRPRASHYYFGDYYAPEYRKAGYFPSHSYFSGGHGYDPIYAHERWRNRRDDQWERRQDEDYRFFRDNRNERPPHTLAAFAQFADRKDRVRRDEPVLAASLANFATIKDTRFKLKLKPVDDNERQRFAGNGREIRDFGKVFRKDTASVPNRDRGDKSEPPKVKIPRSPIFARTPDSNEGKGRGDGPPKRPKGAESDEKVLGKTGDPRRGQNPDSADDPKRGDRRGDSRVNPGNDPKVDPKDMPKRDPGAGPKDLPKRGDRRGEPKTDDPKDQPKTDPKGDPRRGDRRGDPKDQPKAEGNDTPKREPGTDNNKEQPKRGDRRGDPKDTPKVDPGTQPGDQPKRNPRVEPKNEPKAEPKDTPKREPGTDSGDNPRRNPRTNPGNSNPPKEPKAEPKREPKTEPRVEQPKREPKVEQPRVEQPKREPKVDRVEQPKREQPRVEQPKREPRVEQPRVEQPKREPRVEQPRIEQPKREQPRVEPRSEPRREPQQPKSEPRQNDQPKQGKEDKGDKKKGKD